MEKIGILGLGKMGSAIAQRMQAEGHVVTSWTRSGRTVDGVPFATLPEVVGASDTLLLSLYDDAAVASVLDAVLGLDLHGKQIIETSTVVPDVLKDRIEQISAKGATAVDAPISGGPDMVGAGTCGVLMGGTDTAAARARETLSSLTQRIFHVGPLGAGLVMKTINNGMLQVYFSGLDELLPLAKDAGIPFETVITILLNGPAGIPMLKDRLPKILGTDDQVGFTIEAAHKDNTVFQRVVKAAARETPILQRAGQRQTTAIKAGLGQDDPAALVRFSYDRK